MQKFSAYNCITGLSFSTWVKNSVLTITFIENFGYNRKNNNTGIAKPKEGGGGTQGGYAPPPPPLMGVKKKDKGLVFIEANTHNFIPEPTITFNVQKMPF